MNVLSLFDGMSCGMIAMQKAGIEGDRYVAYEIDKYAIKTAQHNFPTIEEKGDVFTADFTPYSGFDFLIGGSPCTYWSSSQSNDKRETVARGMGWDLFSQYVRALHEAKPKYFIYENNKSMSKEIRDSIREAFGFEEICINSALVSAQNRQRYYWVGKRNEDGTYSKVDVQQPMDRGILLKDVLDNALPFNDCDGGKSHTLTASYYKIGSYPFSKFGAERNKQRVAIPVNTTTYGKSCAIRATCYKDGIRNIVANDIDRRTGVAEPCVEINKNPQKSRCVSTVSKDSMVADQVPRYATPVEWDGNGVPTKAVCGEDGKTYTVYPVSGGHITIKGKSYKIKLIDGYYIIRKLTVSECKRLQTVPEWYEFPVSSTQAYKMLGNGWTVDVIAHILKSIQESDKT